VYTLRVATVADVDFLVDVVIEATQAQGRMPPDIDEPTFRSGYADWTAQQLADADEGSTTFVIEVDGLRAGRLRVVRTREELELAGIQLLPGQQSRGIGSRIITDLLTEATDAGLAMVLSVEKDNPRAQALYLRLGFVVVGETANDVVMRRPTAHPPEPGRHSR
jgi:ribosomal protein S18 acetylase RimI-like enzyme